jgi:hypothetical protein
MRWREKWFPMPPEPEVDPSYVGPPPVRPEPPRDEQPAHILHLLLSIITGGIWILVWVLVAVNTSSNNRANRNRYDGDLADWRVAYDKWQRRYHEVYGTPPPPSAG